MARVLRIIFGVLGVLLFINGVPRRAAHAQDDVSWLLTQINNLRASQGLPAYALNAQLSAAATQQSQYLVETCNIVHTWPDGTSPQSRAAAQGYTGDHVIENIYAGTNATAADAWNFWISSPVHYNALVNTLENEVGIGVAHGGLCGHAYTLVFGHGSGDGAVLPVNPAAPPPTARPYVPPPPTPTPTATILTLTPSATWTLTPSYTPSPTFTAISPTATPLNLPTVPVHPAAATAVAVVPSPTATEVESAAEAEPPTATPVSPPALHQAVIAPQKNGFELRDLIPVALVGQIVLIGIAGFVYFRKTR